MVQYSNLFPLFVRKQHKRAGGMLALMLVFGAVTLCAQKPGTGSAGGSMAPSDINDYRTTKGPTYEPIGPKTPTFEDLQYRKYIKSRLKSMSTDAEKLLNLTKELNGTTDAGGKGTLSREDLRRLDAIEKLAHNVKWKMQLAVDGSQGR